MSEGEQKKKGISHKVSFVISGEEAERFYGLYAKRQKAALEEIPPRRVTYAEIDAEIYSKGLGVRGDKAPTPSPAKSAAAAKKKWTDEDIAKVKKLRAEGMPVKDIARETGIPERTCYDILKRP